MKTWIQLSSKLAKTLGVATLVLGSVSAEAASLALTDMPLFLNATVAPLNMLVIGRDHKLFMAAYNDASDLNGDGILDIGYKGYLAQSSGGIDYFGYFDSYKCYSYSSGQFTPSTTTADKTCGGSTWSGDFLNYVSMARIDALRKVLYGGYRYTDSTSSTVLERSYIPQDAHSWGKEYQSISRDGYDINKYTPYTAPSSGKYILFANTTLTSNLTSGNYQNPPNVPLMRVMRNTTHRVWEWLSKEAPVAGSQCANSGSWSNTACDITPDDYTVRVQVCVSGKTEANCKQYPNGSYKPTGLLHQYGENDQMYFGLLSGSYTHNFEGGVVRKEVTSFKDEVDSNTGMFSSPKKGMIASLDGFKIEDSQSYNSTYYHNYNCGNYWDQNQTDGNCRIWGNPVGEMMFESLRYFAGASTASSQYTYTSSGSDDAALSLPEVTTWKNLYGSTASGGLGYPVCAKPFDTVISDVNTSRDSELPGSPWNSSTFSLPTTISSLNVSTMGQQIWNNEFGSSSQNIFIGEVGSTADGMPTVKSASSFGNIRGLSPEEPTRQGTYYSASVAYFGLTNDINGANGNQNLNTFAVAMSSPIPRMQIPVNGKTITLVPLGKVVCGPSNVSCSSNISNGSWQPTEQIVAFYIDTMKNMPGQAVDNTVNGGRPYLKFRINFEDAEQGNDYDMDEIVLYEVTVNSGGTLNVQLTTEYASAGYESHIGYVISGSTKDGVYLETAGGGSTTSGSSGQAATHYKYDTPSLSSGNQKWAGDCVSSPGSCSFITGVSRTTYARTFTPGSSGAATLLNDPLWYAAKYGGFNDKNKNGVPDSGEWDTKVSGTPDNYFLVTNALTLGDQLARAFKEILGKSSSASAASLNSGSVSSNSRLYQAKFLSVNWIGQLLSYKIDPATGNLILPEVWDASKLLPAPNSRQIITVNSNGTPSAFTWASLDSTRQTQLDTSSTLAQSKLAYLRGDSSKEGSDVTDFRMRVDDKGNPNKLGDIVSSSPGYSAAPAFRYSDSLETAAYSSFQSANATRTPMVYVGANDGMLHGFNGNTGVEAFGFIPSAVFGNLKNLTAQNYSHQYFVDGSPTVADAFIGTQWRTVLVGGLNKGGQEIYALNVNSPSTLSNAETNASNIVMWEFTDSKDAACDLGYTYSKPQVARLKNGKWVAIFGNGYNNTDSDGCASTTGQAALYIVDLATGSLIKKIPTGVGMSADPTGANRANGLATPSVVDINGDGISEYVYAGDLFGNLWKFNLNNTDPTQWAVAFKDASNKPIPLFQAKDSSGNAQPITSRPRITRGPNGNGLMVLFGTGKYLEIADKNLTPRRDQSFYGIYDQNTGADTDRVTSRSSLTQQTIIYEQNGVRVSTNLPLGSNRGWYIDLVSPSGYQNEKQVSDSVIRDGKVIFTTTIPDSDPCAFGGSSWIMELDAITGSRLDVTPFDINNDGKFDNGDFVQVTLADGSKIWVPATGVQSTEGILTSPAIVDDSGPNQSKEYKYTVGTSGNTQKTLENAQLMIGRQTWRQIR